MTKKKRKTRHTNLGINFLLGKKIFMDLSPLEFRSTAERNQTASLHFKRTTDMKRMFDDVK